MFLAGLKRGGWTELFDLPAILLVVVTAIVAMLAIIPVFYLLWSSFKPITLGNLADFSLTNFTLANFARAYADPAIVTMLLHSFFFAAGSMAVAFLFGGVIALLVERTDAPMKNIAYGLMFIPLIVPNALNAIGWVLLLSPNNGILNVVCRSLGFKEAIFNAYTLPAMFWVEGLSMAPLVFLMFGASLRGMDPSLEEAAFTSGASRWTAFRTITVKLMTPALAGIGLLQFIRGIEAFEVPYVMGLTKGLRVFSTAIYVSVRELSPPDYGSAFVLSLLLVVLAVAGIVFYHRILTQSERYATISGKGYRPRIFSLGKWRYLAGVFIGFYFFAAVVLPFSVLLWTSFLPYYQAPSLAALQHLSLESYRDLFARAIFYLCVTNTVVLATTVSAAGILLSLVISWIVIRWKPKGSSLLELLAFLPYAVPGIAMGFAFMVAFLSFPNPIYGTLWIIMLAYLTTFLPIGTRFTHAAISQIRAELEEAAATSGAGLFNIMRHILIPLILPSLVSGGLYLFILCVKVVSAASILWNPDSVILSIYVLQLWGEGRLPVVSALSVVTVVSLTLLFLAARLLVVRRSVAAEISF